MKKIKQGMAMKTMIKVIVLLCFLVNAVYSGPNSEAIINIDFEEATELIDSDCPDEGAESEITCAVKIENVSNLDGYAFLVKFDPHLVQLEWASKKPEGTEIVPFLETRGGKIGAFISNKSEGVVDIAASLIGKNKDEAPDGSGVLAYLKFTRLKSGDANIHISDAQIINSDLVTDTVISKLQ